MVFRRAHAVAKLVLPTAVFACLLVGHSPAAKQLGDAALRQQALVTMRKSAEYFSEQVASHGGYVYVYSLNLSRRWGEGEATTDQIWVQPPGTPTVGMALLEAYRATGEPYYLEAATTAAEALTYGQLESGGWTNCIDFNPNGSRTANYRSRTATGKNNSSLDDGQTQMAIRLLMHVDEAHRFQHSAIHESAQFALNALLAAQFPNGGFPQIWTGPSVAQPVVKASYPEFDWKTEGRVKNYWDMYTLNDNTTGYVAQTLLDAYRIYDDPRYLEALRKLGDFLALAQMPDPQPGWAQQYSYQMHPIWARSFEPAAVAGDESQEAIETLLAIHAATGDARYLEPIPRALEWLNQSRLPDGRLARFYELRTNRPLYMKRSGNTYTLTYDDSNLPSHYGWKVTSRLEELKQQFQRQRAGDKSGVENKVPDERTIRAIIDSMDDEGRWVSVYAGEPLVGQTKLAQGERYISSERFARNLTTLSQFVAKRENRSD